MIAIQILAAVLFLSYPITAARSAIREHRRRKAIAEYELLAARYLKCIEVAYSREIAHAEER